MATGMAQGGGLMGWPDVPALGPASWAELSGTHPDSPLVGGRGTFTGGTQPGFRFRRVAIGAPDPSPQVGGGPHHVGGSFAELANFRHNPLPWVLVAAIVYLGLVHVHLSGRVGKSRGAFGIG